MPRIEFNAPVTVCYALAAVAILPVQGKLAIHGPIRPLDGDFLLSLFTWTLAHGGMTHLLSNIVVILLTGPLLEDRFGSLGCWPYWSQHRCWSAWPSASSIPKSP